MKRSRLFWNAFILAVVLTVFVKTALTVIGVNLARYFNQIPLTTIQMDLSAMIPSDKSTPWYYLAQPFYRFDALWYDAVARTNYAGLSSATPFFPLYSWAVKFLSNIVHLPFYITASFFNTFLTFLVFFLFYILVSLKEGLDIAQKAVVFLAFFPTAFFFLAPYAEPMLLGFVFASMILMEKRYYLASFVFGFLAAMTKPYGFLIVIPLAVSALSDREKKEKITRLVFAGLIFAGTLLVFYFQNMMIIGNTPAITGGVASWDMAFVNPAKSIIGSLIMFRQNPFDMPNVLNLLAIGTAAGYLIYCRNKTERGYWWFVLILFLFFTSYQVADGRMPLKSFGRYFLAFFPVFIALAKTKMNHFQSSLYMGSGMLLMAYFFIYYVFGFFVF